ncbi:hypothetical protein H7F53_09410, partial [Novosphingobium piscinae]|nr:hypothetical protein [Novosphingobium piscinae]
AGASGFALAPDAGAAGAPVELRAAGLPFAALGLAPGPAAQAVAPRHGFALALPQLARTEPVRVVPLVDPPPAAVLRVLAGLGCALADWPGLVALGWEAAGTAMAPDYVRRMVGAWLDGGAFPGLGLAALVREGGLLRSDGLIAWLGHEIALHPAAGETPAATARRALRAMHGLVEGECTATTVGPYLGDSGLGGAFSADGRLLTLG